MTEPLYAVTAPVLEVDGRVRGELARDLVHLEVEETCDGLRHLTLRLVAVGPPEGGGREEVLLYLDGRILDFGQALKVAIGPQADQQSIFDGRISAIGVIYDEGQEPEVCVHAEDRLMDLRMTRRSHTYEETTDAEIAREIADQHGLQPQVDADGPSYDRIQQWNMSDLAFLRERARLLQAEVWVDGETLHFKTRDRRDGRRLTLIRGRDLIRVEARADLADQRTAVRVSGFDADRREAIDEEAGPEVVEAEVAGGRTGPRVLAEAFGERVSRRLREVPLSAAEAADWAAAEMRRRARRFAQVQAVTNGTPRLGVGSLLTLERLGAPFDGEGWYVTRVCHSFDLTSGHRTHFDAERASMGAAR